MKRFVGLWVVVGFLSAGGAASAAKEKPPLIERLEEATGLELTLTQREKIAAFSREHAEELNAMHAAFLADISKVVGLSQRVLRERVFTQMSPSFGIDEARREAIERLTDGYLSYRQKRSLKEVEARWQEERAQADEGLAGEIAAVTDLTAEKVLELMKSRVGQSEPLA